MFETKKVKCFLMEAKFSSLKEDVVVALKFYVTPITYDLASEIEPHIADRLFRKSSGSWNPVAEVPKMTFSVEPEACSMKYQMHEQIEDGAGLIPRVEFKDLEAFKLFADDPNFTLSFKAVFPISDKETAWIFISRLKSTFLMTFARVQEDLPFPKPERPKCEYCEKRATMIGTSGTVACDEHVHLVVGEEVRELVEDDFGHVRSKQGPAPKARKKAIEENQKLFEAEKPKKKPGRPPGSKNKERLPKPLKKGRKR